MEKENRLSEMLKKDCKFSNVVSAVRHTGKQEIHSDVLGSYTGMTEEGYEPVQDADDL